MVARPSLRRQGYSALVVLILGATAALNQSTPARTEQSAHASHFYLMCAIGIAIPLMGFLMFRNECLLDLTNGNVLQRRGFIVPFWSRSLVSAQIDLIVYRVITRRSPNRGETTFSSVRLRVGLSEVAVFEGNVDQGYDLAQSLHHAFHWPVVQE